MAKDLQLKIVEPDAALSDFVASFWMLANDSDNGKDIATLPDGRVDVLFTFSETEPFHVMLMDLEKQSSQVVFSAKTDAPCIGALVDTSTIVPVMR